MTLREMIGQIDAVASEMRLPSSPYVGVDHDRNSGGTKIHTKIKVCVMLPAPIGVKTFYTAADIDVDNWQQPVIDAFRLWAIDLKDAIESAKV
jgi:hypothetical protein